MKRAILAIGLLAYGLTAHANEVWPKLWRNADQRGEALLRQGDAAAAIKTYADPRRKAYAELKSGDYAAAARDFSHFSDGESKYNQGNALAFAGDLPGALKAYDAALQRDLHNADARHNRDLVANALKQKPQQQQKSGGGKSQDDQSRDSKQGGQSGSSQDQGKQGQDKHQGERNGNGKNAGNDQPTGKSGNPDAKGGNDDKGNAAGKNGRQGQPPAQDAQQSGRRADTAQGNSSRNPAANAPAQQDSAGRAAPQQAHAGAAGQAKPRPEARQSDDAEQARQDAEAGLGKTARSAGAGNGTGANPPDGKMPAAATPLSENQLAQEQWLQSIPDDPGGLLRRKFLIEHLMRQQKAQP